MAFTNYIQQITATNGTTHDLVDSSASHYVKGTQTSSTNAWTGALPDGVSAYYDGLSIDYFLPYAGTSNGATLNLGSKGAKPVYVGNGTGAVTTHFPQYSVIHLTYIINSSLNSGNGCWKATSYYNTNTTYSQANSNSTGITVSDHSTTSVGSASGWSAGTLPTLGTAISLKGVSGTTTVSSKKSGANSTVPTLGTAFTIPNVTAVGSGSCSISGAVDSSDNTQLNITISHTHTAPTLGTAFTVPNVTSVGTASTWAFEDKTVATANANATSIPNVTGVGTLPALTVTSTTVVSGKTHTVTDPKHTHTLS